MRRIGVFCGSALGNQPVFAQHAKDLAKAFVENNICMVNGGGNNGIMGVMSDEMIKLGGQCIGVIPEFFIDWGQCNHKMTEIIRVEDLLARKSLLLEMCEGFVIFPGGLGTIDELYEVLTAKQLEKIDVPIAIYNLNGYFDHILDMNEHMISNGFVRLDLEHLYSVHNDSNSLISRLNDQ